jgi:hypothetical protein
MRSVPYPATKSVILAAADGKTVEGWELSFFLDRSLTHRRYEDLRSVMTDLEDWLEKQG